MLVSVLLGVSCFLCDNVSESLSEIDTILTDYEHPEKQILSFINQVWSKSGNLGCENALSPLEADYICKTNHDQSSQIW